MCLARQGRARLGPEPVRQPPSGGKKAAGNCPCTRVGEQRGQPPKEASDVRGRLVLFRL